MITWARYAQCTIGAAKWEYSLSYSAREARTGMEAMLFFRRIENPGNNLANESNKPADQRNPFSGLSG